MLSKMVGYITASNLFIYVFWIYIKYLFTLKYCELRLNDWIVRKNLYNSWITSPVIWYTSLSHIIAEFAQIFWKFFLWLFHLYSIFLRLLGLLIVNVFYRRYVLF